MQAHAYRQQYGFNSVVLFPVNLYGPRDNFELESSHVIPALIRKIDAACASEQPEVVLWGDGTPTREFLYVEDAADAIVAAAERYDDPAPVNLGTGTEISIHDLAGAIARETGFEGEIRWDATKPDGQPRRVLDVSRAVEAFGWRASVPFEECLRRTVAWYLETATV